MTVEAEKLLKMAEQIAANLNYTDDQLAVDVKVAAKVGDHLTRFWDPRMKEALRLYADNNPAALSPLLQSALKLTR
jgi:formate dehydrogenase subunit delta